MKTHIFNLIKVIIIISSFYLIKDKINFVFLFNLFDFDLILIGTSILIFVISQVLLGLRLKYSTLLFNEKISSAICINYSFISKLYTLYGALSLFADLNKYFLLNNIIRSKKKIIYIIFLDRTIGVISLLSIIIIGLLILYTKHIKIEYFYIFSFFIFTAIFFIIKKKITKYFYIFFKLFFISLSVWILLILSAYIVVNNGMQINKLLIIGILITTITLIIPITPFGIGTSQLISIYLFEFLKLDPNIGFFFISYVQLLTILIILIISIPLNIQKYYFKK